MLAAFFLRHFYSSAYSVYRLQAFAPSSLRARYSFIGRIVPNKKEPIQPLQPTLTIRPFSIMITPLQPPSAALGERG
jgi:hypothetical protein